MARVLNTVGFHAATASNGAKGIPAYREKPEGVVIVDLVMPEKEGLETIRDLRGEFPSAVILAMTGHPAMQRMLKAEKASLHPVYVGEVERGEQLPRQMQG